MERDTLQVRTAENVGIGFDTAGIGSRVLAFLVDALVIGVLTFCLDLLVVGLSGGDDSVGLRLVLGFTSFAVLVAYFVVLETATGGRTPGKRALGLRVIRTDGAAPGLQEAMVRGVARVLDLGIGILPMFINPQSRRFGDLAAGTLVVRERRAPVLPPPPPPVMLRTPDAGPEIDNTAALGATEYSTLRAFLGRQGLTAEQRHRLADTIATRLLDRMQLPQAAPERSWPPELFIERLYLQLSTRFGGSS